MRIALIGLATAAPAASIRNIEQIKQAAGQVAQVLMSYYQPGKTAAQGSLYDRSNDPSINGFQWWEMGVWWSAIMEYSGLSGDAKHLNLAVPALTLASYRETGSFLGRDRSASQIASGKWNDDILWWAFGPMIGAELFPGQVMPGGVSYLQLAKNTYDEVWEQWDTTSCGGGIFWSRDRITKDPKRQFFKSSITHGQQLLLGARLYGLTKDRKYLEHAEMMYRWLKQGIVTKEWDVYDGVNMLEPGKCALFNDIHSYNSGLFAGAYAYWFSVTKDPKWINDADNIMRRALDQFTLNGIVTDPCEAIRKPNKVCAVNQIYFKGILVRGMGYHYQFTNNKQLKDRIQDTLDKTAKAMFAVCDNNMVCNSQDWAAGQPGSAKNVHAQINALEVVNAMMMINNAGLQKLNAPTAAPPTDALDQLGSATTYMKISGIVTLLSLLLL